MWPRTCLSTGGPIVAYVRVCRVSTVCRCTDWEETTRDDPKLRAAGYVRDRVWSCHPWEPECGICPVRDGAKESARHRSDRLDGWPELGSAKGQSPILLRGPVQQRPHHDRGWIAKHRDI